ncbi:MAG: FAD-dependent oxidoreductase [Pseudomonadota bacterium]
MRVLICGGGVIGTSIAYALSQRQVEAVVIERTGIACAASGKSGGFLALDWCDGTPLEPLARRSFALHEELAATLDGGWDYRRLETLALASSARRMFGRSGGPLPDWIAPEALLHQRLGTTRTTAQVDPGKFTRGMMDAAIERGARLHEGTVTGLLRDQDRVTGARVDGTPFEGDAVVIAMGPWSVLASRWLSMPMIYGLKGNSIVFRPDRPISPHALFVEHEAADGASHAPEVFPRPDGTTYVCGLSSEAPLPVDPVQVACDEGAREKLLAMVRSFAPALCDGEVLTVQACYRPATRDGLPLIGRVPGAKRAFVATGHSVWGILNAPATGEAMAQLLTGQDTTVDLAAFDPARLPSLPPDALQGGS